MLCDAKPGDFDAAVAAAKAADYAVLMMGIDGQVEGEGHDRTLTTLPGNQSDLVLAVLAVQPNTVLVLVHGGAMSIGVLKGATPAIVDAFYGGEMAAPALASVLFGDYNPTGKLAVTMYPADFVNVVPLTDMGVQPNKATGNPGRTHMYYTGQAEYEFGDGLSYDDWDVEWAAQTAEAPLRLDLDLGLEQGSKNMSFGVTLRNKGTLGGGATVLAMWRPRGGDGGPLAPLRQKLFAFDGLRLQPGEAGRDPDGPSSPCGAQEGRVARTGAEEMAAMALVDRPAWRAEADRALVGGHRGARSSSCVWVGRSVGRETASMSLPQDVT